ncbi:MAG TPA: acyl-CoA dehydrogenase family protein [Tepidiformaceae bacterium]|nr:acyl-CoA dehydrogenase family protein [Tepidiformaceae bacterium]
MRFKLTPEQERFRDEIRGFLRENLPNGGPSTSGEVVGWSPEFSRKLAERHWVALPWPKEYGGLAASYVDQVIFNEEMAYNRAPIGAHRRGVFYVGPILMLYGTDAQKAQHLSAIAGGSNYFCQLFSEPAAGSDLASAQTRAVRDGDDYVINGQKIWTSDGHRAEHGWLVARTNPDAPKHKGLSSFIIDMNSPGIDVRPLVNVADKHSFNEVFFDNVRVPASRMVGEENRGWYLTAATLDFERSSVASFAGTRRFLDDLVPVLKAVGRWDAYRLSIADLVVTLGAGALLSYSIASMQDRGIIPTREASAAKLLGSELNQKAATVAVQALGLAGQVRGGPGAVSEGQYAMDYLASISATIAGGTSEIQRNVIANRGLGLPRG